MSHACAGRCRSPTRALLVRRGASYSTSLSLAMCDDVASDSASRLRFWTAPGYAGHVRVCGVRVGVPAAPCGATASTRTRVNPIQAPAPGAVRASATSARFRRGRCSYAPRASPLVSLARFLCLLHATFATPGVLRVTRNAHGFVRIRYNSGFLHTAVRLYLRTILVAFSCRRRRRRPDALIVIVRMRISEHVVDHDGGNGLGLVSSLVVTTAFNGLGRARRIPFHCLICLGTDHPTNLCPCPLAPGYRSPTPDTIGALLDASCEAASPSSKQLRNTHTKFDKSKGKGDRKGKKDRDNCNGGAARGY
ncbi:hypothetical protein C8F04DRAFT_1255473 [Mycena alexandri]|uniref:Uncharacterized protein n=1 Tax=Mycena alexandri TaxID=1745969 RepID=A0AAD6T5N6_9AGAR|nr:hypothetical protein C8F04DRAFT_1255473 [Mycena alexandri]